MLDWTDRHCRYFHRLLTRRALLYTEMVTTAALTHGDPVRLLDFDPFERPLALQLGGSNPAELASCARMAEAWGYDEVNLNVGCPSERVHAGRFGACLMAEPGLVADCVSAMGEATTLPVTVKTRIGIDDMEAYESFASFIDRVAQAGCRVFIVHARKAWLKGLSPHENRTVPPLRYEFAYRLKADFSRLEVILNGGIATPEQGLDCLAQVDGIMMGRGAYENPYSLASVDRLYFGDTHPVPDRAEVVRMFLPYVERRLREGVPLKAMTRHILGIFHGRPGARAFRRYLSENAARREAGAEVLERAAGFVSP